MKALILGITSSIGKELVPVLVKKGYEVYGTSTKDEEINGVNISKVDFGNIAQRESFKNAIETTNLDLVINCVSTKPIFDRFEKISLETFSQDLEINVVGLIDILQFLIPKLNPDATIILVLSEVISTGSEYTSSYNITKFAELGLLKTLSNELKTKKVRVMGISPGMMQTDLIKDWPSFVKTKYLASKNKKELIKPSEVAKRIVEIVSKGENGKIYDFF